MAKSSGNKKQKKERRPRVLVLEGLSGTGEAIREAGADVIDRWPISVDSSADAVDVANWDALVLTGGGDVDPRLYGCEPHKEVYGVSETRDLLELYALEAARQRGVPVLGICRGAQIINVASGGTLHQHMHGHRGTSHAVEARGKTVAARAMGGGARVVSLHHQKVARPAKGYFISARAKDGTPEAIESRDGRVLGVQFHPEMDSMEAYAAGIFRWLVVEAARRAGLPAPVSVGKRERVRSDFARPSRYHSVGRRRRRRGKVGALDDAAVSRSWLCPRCGMLFDLEEDRDDHLLELHDDERYRYREDWWVNRPLRTGDAGVPTDEDLRRTTRQPVRVGDPVPDGAWPRRWQAVDLPKRGNPRKQLTERAGR